MSIEELKQLDLSLRKSRGARDITLWSMIVTGILVSLIWLRVDKFSANAFLGVFLFSLLYVGAIIIVYAIMNSICGKKAKKLSAATEKAILKSLGLDDWKFTSTYDSKVYMKSSRAVDDYNDIKFFKDDSTALIQALNTMEDKQNYNNLLSGFLSDNEYKNLISYPDIANKMTANLLNTTAYKIRVSYSSPTGRSRNSKALSIEPERLSQLAEDKSLLMTKGEYNKYLKECAKEQVAAEQHRFYEKVNEIIDFANKNKEILVNNNDKDELDRLVASLFDRTINSIKKIKSLDSEEWDMIAKVINDILKDITAIADKNDRILAYYSSDEFLTLKNTCDALMASQKEFNEYIDEKVKSITDLFGTAVIRNETNNEDKYNYIHPYKKSVTPFTAEVSASVFESAENNPLAYVIKFFYPVKANYPEQIRKLQLLLEELATLREAKQIIENYKQSIQQYLANVPDFIMENDEEGFYSRLGFATINENTLTVEYKFVYTSGAGYSQRYFTIPMTEETIIKLIELLESKLTMTAFTKEQRSLMTAKLRQHIKERDNFTCKHCGNSTHVEPNLLLEIDHIIPVSKGGCTEETNLQTLCWKCNREKSNKLIQV